MEYNAQNELVVCPFGPYHRVLKSRLAFHIQRCSKNYEGEPLVICQYNSTHLMKQEELAAHTLNCPSGKQYRMKQDMEPVTPAPPHPTLNDDCEDWDNEPPVPPYDPEIYCKNNLIIRNVQGQPPAARREFRESERVRLRDLAKKKE